MNNLWTDTGYISLNHVNEQLCGDRVEIIGNNEKSLTMVLADGLGSGVKANILSTLTSKIICTMMANGMPIEECVDTIAKTLPVCSVRQVAYSTFTIIRITDNTTAEIIQFDNPNVILLRNGKSVDYPIVSRVIEGKTILESRIPLQLHDVFIAMSDGAIYAGVGKTMNFGWQRENIIEYAERLYDDTLSAKMIASMIVDECNRLYEGEPGDDTTVAAVRIRERTPVNLLMGPPADPRDATKMMTLFFSKEGKKNRLRRHHLPDCGRLSARNHRHLSGLRHRPRHSSRGPYERRGSCDRGRHHHEPSGGIRQGLCGRHRPYQPVERADGRSLANRPAFVRVCHGHQFFYRQGHQSGAPEPGSAHYLRHQNTPGTGAFRISGKDGQTNQSELLLSRKPRRKAGFSQFRRFLIY